jgi:aldose 1-epimerase
VADRITWQTRANRQGLDGRVAVLDDGQGGVLEVWPALGFNAYRWCVQGHELLYADPGLFEDGRPTRSGIPVLFPFPNRIRAGAYTWNGKSYQLPLTGDGGKSAIHGFACRSAWRVIDEGADAASTWITGEFQISRDAPAALPVWPADARLRLTYRLSPGRLRIQAVVDCPGGDALPFGLGYHPYFLLAPFGGESAVFTSPATQFWELQDSLPTGVRHPVSDQRDLRPGHPIAGLKLDDVLTALPATGVVGSVRSVSGTAALQVLASPDFREAVVFTPPHRQAVCLEPYTCTTDAINLEQRGIDAGWRVLPPGQSWQGVVELAFTNP